MQIQVRRRSPSDLTRLAEILVRVHAQDGYPVEGVGNPTAWLAPPRQLAAWTATGDGKPIGQAVLTSADPHDEAARIWKTCRDGDVSRLAIPARLFVDPCTRHLGAAKALVGAVRDQAAARDLSLALDVMLKDAAAINLYERSGFVQIGTFQHQYGSGSFEPAAVFALPG